jgi:5-methylcytosine-specific restriction endonuclease McrA
MQRHKRANFSQTYRLRVAWLQDYKCKMCDSLLHYTFEVDHNRALFEGGTNDEANLQALCTQCHRIKSGQERGRGTVVRLPTMVSCNQCRAKYSLYFHHICKQ